MLFEQFFEWMSGLITPLIEGIPDWDLAIDPAAIAEGWSKVADLNFFLPIAEVTALVMAAYAFGPAALALSVSFWLLIGVLRGGQSKL